MTLLDAQQYDPAKVKRRRIKIALIILTILILAGLAFLYRNWPAEHVVNRFFAALQKQDFETAYGIYFNDPDWRQHPQQHAQYPYSDFYRDWGTGGEWGRIRSYRIYGSVATKGWGSQGTVVEVVVNERAERARIYVLKDKTLTVYPY